MFGQPFGPAFSRRPAGSSEGSAGYGWRHVCGQEAQGMTGNAFSGLAFTSTEAKGNG